MRSSRASVWIRPGRGLWLGVAGCLLGASCTIERADVRTPGGEPPEADTTRVRLAVEAIAGAIGRGDRAALESLYHDSLMVYRSGRILGGPDALESSLVPPSEPQSRTRLRIRDVTVRLEDGMAWATFRYERFGATASAGQGAGSVGGLATLIFRESVGRWRVIHAHLSEGE